MSFNLTLIAQALTFALFIWFTVKVVWPFMLRAIEARSWSSPRLRSVTARTDEYGGAVVSVSMTERLARAARRSARCSPCIERQRARSTPGTFPERDGSGSRYAANTAP